ncbi:MAG: hypothetical protein ACKOIZ_02885, partial [Actinomycetota bacterium]
MQSGRQDGTFTAKPGPLATAEPFFAAIFLGVHAGAADPRTRHLPKQPVVSLRVPQVNRVLGTNLSPKDVAAKLGKIGFACTPKKIAAKKGSAVASGPGFAVKVPSWRPDC